MCWVMTGLFWAGAAIASTRACDDAVRIAPKFVVGQTHYLEWSQNSSVRKADDKDSEPPKRFRQTWGVIEKVESISPDGTARIRMTIDRVANDFDAGPMSQRFDSDFDAVRRSDHSMAPLFRAMIGETMTMEVANDGNVKSFEGLDALARKLGEVVEKSPDPSALRDKFERMKFTLNDGSGRAVWGESHLALFPYREVKPGDTWSRVVKQPFPSGAIEITIDCRLAKITKEDGRSLAHVTFDARVAQPAAPAPGGKMPVAQNLHGRSKGAAVIDIDAGICFKEEESGAVEFDVPAPDRSESPTSTSLAMRQKMDCVTRVLTLEEREKEKQDNGRLANKSNRP